jgi:hypothetical protein
MESRHSHPQSLAGAPGLRRTHHQRLPRRRPRRLPHPEVARLSRECRIGVDGCEEGSCRRTDPHLRIEMWGTQCRGDKLRCGPPAKHAVSGFYWSFCSAMSQECYTVPGSCF